jgi:hypothetical protein
MSLDMSLVSQAIVIWTGWGQTAWPARDEARLVQHLGSETAAEIFPCIRELEADFYASDARFTAADLKEMGDKAAVHFRKAHPEISEDAVEALAWCYTWDYK